ncbi:stage II sporulation protein M [Streptomyces sp. XM4193]|uniref:stage II sporulation protein M n=1 Tax=Streptomyces sp. XM4193 TaxID=2929782 RepID=UPI001FFA3921|nr:stage II sporulation protein M [Streptomyces sp. XM4193]MCK1796994.1 stage II sporulation protein M [Streptomyces sp. XM4193]
MDLDVFVTTHSAEWERLDRLVRRGRRLTGAEVDELVELYQRAAVHLSQVRSSAPDPVVVARLTTLVARARSAVTSPGRPAWRDAADFFTTGFPAALYRTRRWWLSTALLTVVVAVLVGWWVAAHPEVRSALATPSELHEMTRPGGQYETYYSSSPAASFAAQVWTNNAQVAALCLAFGAFLGLPVVAILLLNAANLGVGLGLMAAAGRLDVFLGLVAPHGLLELTAVFVAAGTGLRLGWTVIDPGPRRRTAALAQEGRAAMGMALGLAVVLLVSGVIEGFVTPSDLPTWARLAIGALAEAAFLLYVFALGRRAVRLGNTGDLDAGDLAAARPTAA